LTDRAKTPDRSYSSTPERRIVMKLAPFAVLAVAAAALAQPSPVSRAVAVVSPLGSSGVSGTVTFSKAEGGLKVSGTFTGLKPGAHGFHVHEFGDCSAPDGASAGGHFNPTGEMHAAPQDAKRHAGDMGNITAGEDGKASVDYVDRRLTFEGPNNVLGRGVIVHANPDDFKTQPTGNAGGRVACGVVGVAKPQ
jgi:Cu-Zn family superoxide dismutase